MKRMTRSISLALISSSMILAGCRRTPDPEEPRDDQQPAVTSGTNSSSTYYGSSYGRGYSPGSWTSGPRIIPVPVPSGGGSTPSVNRPVTTSGTVTSGLTSSHGSTGGLSSSHSGGFGSTGISASS